MRTRGTWALVVAFVCLLLVPAASAKEGVVARLTQPLATAPSGGVHIDFVLEDEQSGRRFSALGVFVRVVTRGGERTELGAEERGSGTGNYTSWTRTRSHQIVDIEIGLAGISSGAEGTRRSDAIFPIANDPYPGRPAAAVSGSAGEGDDAISMRTPALVLAVAVLALGAALVFRRRSRLPLIGRRALPRL